MWMLLSVLLACWGDDAYIVKGTVVEVHDGRVVLDHEAIEGLMPPMVMPFEVRDPAMLEALEPGHRVLARYQVHERGGRLEKIRVVGRGPAPTLERGVEPVRPGRLMPAYEVATHDGGSMVVGRGQEGAVALTLIYTRCPVPEFCPAMVGRLQALEAMLGEEDDVTLLAVTLDPDFDTVEVLSAYAVSVGAGDHWKLGRVAPEVLEKLAMNAGMSVLRKGDEIVHALRLLVIDEDGRLVERYDDARFPANRVVEQLRTGGPPAPPNMSGTSTPADPDAGG